MRPRFWQTFFLSTLFVSTLLAGDSRIELVTLNSPALGITKKFNIYLPEGYDESSDRYPVVYLFRGHEREWVNPNEDGSRGGKMIKDVADELNKAGAIGRMILVMPGLSSDDNAVAGIAVNFVDVSQAGGKSGVGTGQFEDYLIDDLIPYVDAHYRTKASRFYRGADGFSLGGYTALMLAAKHPELFSSAGGYDATLMWLDFNDLDSPGPLDDGYLYADLFNPNFGLPPRDIEYMSQYNPPNLVRSANAERLSNLLATQFLITSGAEFQNSNRSVSQHMVDLLAMQGLTNGFADIRLTPTAIHNWFHADLHARKTLPLHWARFEKPITPFAVELLSPQPGMIVDRDLQIRWSSSRHPDNAMTTLRYSPDRGNTWTVLATLPAADTVFVWNTLNVSDGAGYLFRVTITGDSSLGVAQTAAPFTINNPGNAAPELQLLSIVDGRKLSGLTTLKWFAADADSDVLQLSLEYSINGGLTIIPIFVGLPNQGEYVWDTRREPNNTNFRLRLRCFDGTVEADDASGVFEVNNARVAIPAAQISHAAGSGGAIITPHVIDETQLTGHLYRLTFDDTTFSQLVYNVEDVDAGTLVLENESSLDGVSEGPAFAGLRLVIKNFSPAAVDNENSGWSLGASPWRAFITVTELSIGFEVLRGFPHPADYRITLTDQVADTSVAAYGVPAVPMKLTVWNLTESRKSKVIFIERVKDQKLSRDDRLLLLEPNEHDSLRVTWSIVFSGAATDPAPLPGDTYIFKTRKPVTTADVYEFRGTLTSVAETPAITPTELTLYPNFPNPFNPATTIRYQLRETGKVKIVLYNLLGEEVRNLFEGRQTAGIHTLSWDGRNKHGLNSSSGVYLCRIDSGNRTVTRKLLLLR